MKFWAVLGSRGCREKQVPTAISKQLFEVVFELFVGKKIKIYFFKNAEKLHNKEKYFKNLKKINID